MAWPDGSPPDMSPHFAGLPQLGECKLCKDTAQGAHCVQVCPTAALSVGTISGALELDMGRCLFCRACERACKRDSVLFSQDWRLATGSRESLILNTAEPPKLEAFHDVAARVFGRSLRLRQVSAGGCGACEADANVLTTVGWDMARFGIQFVASPRHADGLLVTGPVTENMRLALVKTWEAMPAPRLVIACGACAISGGPFAGNPEVAPDGLRGIMTASGMLPVHLYVPGCPPHPLTLLDGLLRLIGRVPDS